MGSGRGRAVWHLFAACTGSKFCTQNHSVHGKRSRVEVRASTRLGMPRRCAAARSGGGLGLFTNAHRRCAAHWPPITLRAMLLAARGLPRHLPAFEARSQRAQVAPRRLKRPPLAPAVRAAAAAEGGGKETPADVTKE